LPNVGALLDVAFARTPATGRTVLTRGELRVIKPFAIVRTARHTSN
jgi:hypothetical protein